MILHDPESGIYVVLKRREDGEVGGYYGFSADYARHVDESSDADFMWKAKRLQEGSLPTAAYKLVKRGLKLMITPKNKRKTV